MSYVAPTGSSANVTWLGSQPYSPPLGNGADVAWATTRAASGWVATAHGTPAAQAKNSVAAAGFGGTAFGAPSLRSSHQALSVPPALAFGSPTTPHDLALQAAGLFAGSMGRPFAQVVRERAQSWAVQAHGASTVALGVAVARWSQAAAPTGSAAARFGAPAAARQQRASGHLATVAGSPAARLKVQSVGMGVVRFGGAAVAQDRPAQGFTAARFGLPEHAAQHRAASLVVGRRFGQPGVLASPARRTYSIFVGRRFGRPAARRQT